MEFVGGESWAVLVEREKETRRGGKVRRATAKRGKEAEGSLRTEDAKKKKVLKLEMRQVHEGGVWSFHEVGRWLRHAAEII